MSSSEPIDEQDDALVVLSAFVRFWKEALKNPSKRRVEPSAANLVSALHTEVHDWLSRHPNQSFRITSSGLHAHLASILREVLQQPRADVGFLARLRPTELVLLQSLISADMIDGNALADALHPLVAMIDSPMTEIANTIAATLPASGSRLSDEDFAYLRSAAYLGVRALLVHDRPDALEGWLKRCLSTGSTAVVLGECASAMAKDKALAQEVQTGFRGIASHLNTLDLETTLPAVLRRPANYRTLWRTAAVVHDARSDFDGALLTLASQLVRDLASTVVHRPLVPVFSSSVDSQALWNEIDELAKALERWFVAQGWLFREDGHAPWGGLLGAACRAELVNVIVEPVIADVLNQNSDAVEALRSWLRACVDQTQVADDKDRLWYLAGRPVQDGVTAFSAAISSTLAEALRDRLRSFSGNGPDETEGGLSMAALAKSLAGQGASSSDAWEWVRWSQFSVAQFSQALTSVSEGYAAVHAFDVVLPVDGARIDPTSWSSGPLVWYTPMTHQLGEAFEDDSDSESASNLHVWQRVDARSVDSAYRYAQAILESALSALTFALSSSEDVTGFRPGSKPWFVYGRVGDGVGGWRLSRHRTELADRKVSAQALERFSIAYAPVIERSVSAVSRTDFELRLMRALFWYRSGRWQRYPTRRFLDHFVALEHLFTSIAPSPGTRKDLAVADGVGALEGAWLFRPFPFSAQIRTVFDRAQQLCALALADTRIENVVERVASEGRSACASAPHWRTHLSPWLSCSFVTLVVSLLPQQPPRSPWQDHILTLEQLRTEEVEWIPLDAWRREAARFKMLLLAQRRHDIVHQALTYVPGIDYEADALTDVVEAVLRHLVEDTLNRPDATTTMQDVLARLVPPWLS